MQSDKKLDKIETMHGENEKNIRKLVKRQLYPTDLW